MNHQPRIPVLHLPPKPKPPAPFPVGARVQLRNCPGGEPGVVRGMQHGRVIVAWSDLGYTGRHRPATLVEVAATDAAKEE